jgi:hypothetical protein
MRILRHEHGQITSRRLDPDTEQCQGVRRGDLYGLAVRQVRGGFLDVGVDPVSPHSILANPSLIFWGLFGSFFSRETYMMVVARATA